MQPDPEKENARAGEQRAVDSKNKHQHPAVISTKTQAESSLEQALLLTESGLPVFPCKPDKTPACAHGFKIATIDRNTVRMLWVNRSGLLIAVATGAVSGVDVLDIDPRHDGDKWLDAHRHQLPTTRVHETRSGGQHWLFHHHDGLRCSTNKIARGVDVRADGGYIIWWPAAGFPVVSDAPIAPWPEWLIEMLMPRRPAFTPVPAAIPVNDRYARAALHRATNVVATAREGCRNETLNREAWSLLRLVDSGVLTLQAIICELADAAIAAGLQRKEIEKTLASAIRSRRAL